MDSNKSLGSNLAICHTVDWTSKNNLIWSSPETFQVCFSNDDRYHGFLKGKLTSVSGLQVNFAIMLPGSQINIFLTRVDYVRSYLFLTAFPQCLAVLLQGSIFGFHGDMQHPAGPGAAELRGFRKLGSNGAIPPC